MLIKPGRAFRLGVNDDSYGSNLLSDGPRLAERICQQRPADTSTLIPLIDGKAAEQDRR